MHRKVTDKELKDNYEYAIRTELFKGTYNDFLKLNGLFGPISPNGVDTSEISE